GMGKTSFVLNTINHLCFKKRIPCLMISLENRYAHIYAHLLALRCDLSTAELAKGKNKEVLEKEKLMSVKPFFLVAPIYTSFEQFKAIIFTEVVKRGVELVFIDAIQDVDERIRMDAYGYFAAMDDEYINQKTRSLKKLCAELNITIIITSQLSRSVEERGGDKKPYLQDLKWSSALEDVADRVLLLYRPSLYGLIEDWNGRNVENLIEVIIAKNRYGNMGTVEFGFEETNGKFIDINSKTI
ncbi:MAG: DnaB-like helicase C-terminal domain-containing protein, partial [Vicingaceae bacterium]